MRLRPLLAILVAAAAAAFATPSARGAGSVVGELGAGGGIVQGDISSLAGETDTIGLDLQAGSKIDVRFSGAFEPSLALLDPQGAPLGAGFSESKRQTVRGIAVAITGRHELRVASADGTQGAYTLRVTPYFDKTVVLAGRGERTFDVALPADAALRGKVKPLPGASSPDILSLADPDGEELLRQPIVGSSGLARLKRTTCSTAGTYRLKLSARGGTGEYTATLVRLMRRPAQRRLDLRNGLVPLSFAKDGVADVFRDRCVRCHDWAGTLEGVRIYASQSLARIRSGNMPRSDRRIPTSEMRLVTQWVAGGLAP